LETPLKTSKSAVVIPAAGIGDALMMMIASHRLLTKGYAVTTLHPKLHEFGEWFDGHNVQCAADLSLFDLIIVENDNSQRIHTLAKKYRKKLSIFYPSYSPSKNPPLTSKDQVFDPTLPMTDNIARATARLLRSREISKNNGLTPPKQLIHRICKERVVIHPTSSSDQKNWPASKYLEVARQLKSEGFCPVFVVSKAERKQWQFVEKEGFDLPLFRSLSDLSSYIYESGSMIGNDSLLGHLASNLHIPSLILADCDKRMLLWKPAWLSATVLTPPRWIPNWKGIRLRKTHWKRWISPKKVLRTFLRNQKSEIRNQK
jgi:heptosyltransferase-3